MKIYVGNLPYSMTGEELEALFAQFGEVMDVFIAIDRETRRSRGFGFVEMADDDAVKAIESLHEHEVDGRKLVVNKARPPKPRY